MAGPDITALAARVAAATEGSRDLDHALWPIAAGGADPVLHIGAVPAYSTDPAACLAGGEAEVSEPAGDGTWRVRLVGQAEDSVAATEALARRLAELRNPSPA